MEEVSCCHCGGYFIPDPRQKNPRYCRELECQRARKAAWQRDKIRGDPDYRANQKRCWQDWCKVHRDYWKAYRQKHPDQARRNRDLQRMRNTRRRSRGRDDPPVMKGSMIAKMDALKVNIYGIPTSCE